MYLVVFGSVTAPLVRTSYQHQCLQRKILKQQVSLLVLQLCVCSLQPLIFHESS